MADDQIRFYGFYALAGQQVCCTIGGLDCGDYVVSNALDTTYGSILVPLGSDPGGLLTASYIQSLDGYADEQAAKVTLDSVTYTIPVVIGLNYVSDGQILRAATADDTKSPQGAALGRTRSIHMAAMLLQNTMAIWLGVTFDKLWPAKLRHQDRTTPITGLEMYNGVYWEDAFDSDHNFDNMLCWRVNRPVPATVCSVSAFLEAEER